MRRRPAFQPSTHFFVCTAHHDPDSGMPSCDEGLGEKVYRALKQTTNAHGRTFDVWVTTAGCLGVCKAGGVGVAVWPESAFYECVTPDDVEDLYAAHIDDE